MLLNFTLTVPVNLFPFIVSFNNLSAIVTFYQKFFFNFRQNPLIIEEVVSTMQALIYHRLHAGTNPSVQNTISLLLEEIGFPLELYRVILLLPRNGFINLKLVTFKFGLSQRDLDTVETYVQSGSFEINMINISSSININKQQNTIIDQTTTTRTFELNHLLATGDTTVDLLSESGLTRTTNTTVYTVYSNSYSDNPTLSLCMVIFFMPTLSSSLESPFITYQCLKFSSATISQTHFNSYLERCLLWYSGGNGLEFGPKPSSIKHTKIEYPRGPKPIKPGLQGQESQKQDDKSKTSTKKRVDKLEQDGSFNAPRKGNNPTNKSELHELKILNNELVSKVNQLLDVINNTSAMQVAT